MATSNMHGRHRFILPTITAVALWEAEVQGQLSDGTWENSSPHDHWKYWCACDAEVGERPGVVLNDQLSKRAMRTVYNVVNLANMKWQDGGYILRDRMLAQARMAIALTALNRPFDGTVCRHAEYMPAELYSFQASVKSGIWKHDFVAEYMAPIDEALAAEFYKAQYTVDELKADLQAIRDAMEAPARVPPAPNTVELTIVPTTLDDVAPLPCHTESDAAMGPDQRLDAALANLGVA